MSNNKQLLKPIFESSQTSTPSTNTPSSLPVYERLNKTPIGHKRGQITRMKSKSFDELPLIDPLVSAHITKQFEFLQEEYSSVSRNRRKSLLRKTSNDDINVGRIVTSSDSEITRPRSTLRPTIHQANLNTGISSNKVEISSPRPHTQPIQKRTLHRGYSKDDNDIPSTTTTTMTTTNNNNNNNNNTSIGMIPHPP